MGKEGTIVVRGGGEDSKAKGFIDALGRIEQISANEMDYDIPERTYSNPARLSFSGVAAVNAMVTTITTFVFAPFTSLVLGEYMPIFGQANPGIMDRIFAYLISAAPAVSFAMFFAYVVSGLYVRGPITKALLNIHVSSYVIGKFVMTFFMLMLFTIIYNGVLTQEAVHKISSILYGIIKVFMKDKTSMETYVSIYKGLSYFRGVLIDSALYSSIIQVLCAGIIGVSYFIAYMRSYIIDIMNKEWG